MRAAFFSILPWGCKPCSRGDELYFSLWLRPPRLGFFELWNLPGKNKIAVQILRWRGPDGVLAGGGGRAEAALSNADTLGQRRLFR